MDSRWWWRFGGIMALVVVAILALLPTVIGDDLPGWYGSLFERRLSLGLDLQGGIHMQVGVEVDKAILDSVERRTEDVSRYCEEEKYACKKVTALEDEPVLIVDFDNNEERVKATEKLKGYLGDMTPIVVPDGHPNALAFRLRDDFSKQRKNMAVLQAIETLRNRIDEMAVKEALISRQGQSSILIQIPGVEDVERARKMIGTTAQLEFKIVDDKDTSLAKYKDELPPNWAMRYDSHRDKDGGLINAPSLEAPKDALGKNMAAMREWLKGKVDASHEVLFEEVESTKALETHYKSYVLFRGTSLTGDTITDARVNIDQQQNRPYVSINFDRHGALLFGKLTGDHVKERMAIVLDGKVKSAPVIQTAITGGRCMITLNAMAGYNELFKEATDLSVVLRAGALPAPVKIEEVRSVGPTLGADSIHDGVLSLIIGSIAVVLFMGVYYRLSGWYANTALVLNVLFVLAFLALFGSTLTLPGLAGLVLTIGIAVDANVLINERIREEMRHGKTSTAAVDAGYRHAFWTIFDSHVTTALTGFVLWTYGTGPIKGFAIVLLIGIACSLFTAIVVTRLIEDGVLAVRGNKTLSI